MMAPDPPREDRHQEHRDVDEVDEDEGDQQPVGTFVVDWGQMEEEEDEDELMFVPQGPHELDMGSGDDESEFSTDDEGGDDDQVPQTSVEEDGRGGGTRGHYQMLIPFPAPQRSQDDLHISTDEGIDQESPAGDYTGDLSLSGLSPSAASNEEIRLPVHSSISNDPPLSMNHEEPISAPKREITLTEEKVETIKSAMLNFTLPPPPWAAEFDEDAWKKRLAECIETKTNSSKETQRFLKNIFL